MNQTSFLTKVGSTADIRPSSSDVIVVSEPETGAMLRTKGRLYMLFEVAPSKSSSGIAKEIADLARQEYYYDLSAGIEVSLRRALRQANRRAAQRLKEHRGHSAIHLACAVIVNNALYASHIGAAQVLLVRRARLFLPGDEPGELADFVHRATTREASSLGAEPDVVPKVWRQEVESGDTLILASGALVDGLGADALKNAAVTLHPRSAAEHIHNRAVADGITGSDAIVFIEVTQSAGAAARVASTTPPIVQPDEVTIADEIRSRVGFVLGIRQLLTRTMRRATTPVATAATKSVAVGLELMPKRGATLPRHPDTARARSRRQRRAVTTMALALLLVAGGVGALAYRDYESGAAERSYQNAVLSAEDDLASAHRLVDRKPPDPDAARLKLQQATKKIDAAMTFPRSDHTHIDALRADIAALTDRMDGVVADLGRIADGATPKQIIGNLNGLYVADPGAGRLWRVFGDPVQTGVVMQRGSKGVGSPAFVANAAEVLYAIDDARNVWRAEGDQVLDISPPDREKWKSITAMSLFASNLYVLDSASGQVWKHESNDGIKFGPATEYLAAPLPVNSARSLAVDGDVWIATTAGDIVRLRRNPLGFTASRIDFVARWQGSTPRASAIQAIDAQGSIYVLDAEARLVLQLTRDGRELARFNLPATLAPPTAFYVSEAQKVAFTLHGTKVVATSIQR